MSLKLLIVTAVALTAACANDPAASLRQGSIPGNASPAAVNVSRESIRPYCPAAGSWINRTRSDNGVALVRVTYVGEHSAYPGICQYIVGVDSENRYLSFGPIPIVPRDLELASGVSAQIFPLAVGNTASFTAIDRSFRDIDTFQYRFTFNVLRRERVTVSNRSYDAFVVSRTEEGMFNNVFRGHEIYWIDSETMLPIKLERRVDRGIPSSAPSWVVTQTGRASGASSTPEQRR